MPPGQPTKLTPETLNKLEQAFMMGCPDTEACLFAEISHQTLYNYQKKHPEYVERKRMLKENPAFQARQRVTGEVSNDTNTAKWYLERKKKDEFGQNQKIEAEITNIEDAINALIGGE